MDESGAEKAIQANETKSNKVSKEDNSVNIEPISTNPFKIEKVPDRIALKIRDSMTPFMKLEEYPNGFKSIQDVKFTWLNIAGMHTRCAIYEDLFLFPRLDITNEDSKWTSGIALRRNSNIAYRWKIENTTSKE